MFSHLIDEPCIVNMSLASPPPLVHKLFTDGKIISYIMNFNKICCCSKQKGLVLIKQNSLSLWMKSYGANLSKEILI